MKDIPMTLTKIFFDHERDIYIWPLFYPIYLILPTGTCLVGFDLFEAPLPLDISVLPVWGSAEEMDG